MSRSATTLNVVLKLNTPQVLFEFMQDQELSQTQTDELKGILKCDDFAHKWARLFYQTDDNYSNQLIVWLKGHWSEQQGCWMVGGSASGVAHTYWLPLPPAPPTTSAGSGKGE